MELARTARPVAHVRVAIVDDHVLMLDGLAARLAQTDLDVALTVSSWDALVAHPAFPVDVVVMDLFLDDNIPIDTKVRALLAAGSAVVVMSRHADPGSVGAALRAGALAFVPKTESSELLLEAIAAAARGERFLPPRLDAELQSHRQIEDPGLGRQEQRALMLYARGRTIKEVAAEMQTTDETVKSYIKRARRKYRRVGVDLGTRVLLRRHAVREGWLAPDES